MNERYEELVADVRPKRLGWWLVIIGLGGFLTWAWLAPLDSGVSAQGIVAVSGNRKLVQPVAGGKITAILAKDGDFVEKGQVLVHLDDTTAQSQLAIAKGQWYSGLAMHARLKSEQRGLSHIEYPIALKSDSQDPRAATAMALQTEFFHSRRAALASEIRTLEESLLGVDKQTKGIEASSAAKNVQLRVLQTQLTNQTQLAQEGYLAMNRVWDLQRSVANLEGAIAEDEGNIGKGKQTLAEIRTRIVGRQQEFRKEVESQLTEINKEVAALESRLQALNLDVANTRILAPESGITMGLSVHTIGGVVGAGSPMMEIVPSNESLKIEAQIAPHLIDKIKPGLEVENLFTALNQAVTPRIPGKVTHVSADAFSDPKQNQTFFKATVEITPEGLKALAHNEIRVGMPVEIFIKTGERSAWSYLVKPLSDRVHGALTEP